MCHETAQGRKEKEKGNGNGARRLQNLPQYFRRAWRVDVPYFGTRSIHASYIAVFLYMYMRVSVPASMPCYCHLVEFSRCWSPIFRGG